MSYPQFDTARRLRLEIRIAAESITVGGVRCAKGGAYRGAQARAFAPAITVFDVPTGVAVEALVVGVARGQEQAMVAEVDVVLSVEGDDIIIFIEAGAEHRGVCVFLRVPQAGAEQLLIADLDIMLPIELVAARFTEIAGLILGCFVHDMAEAQCGGPDRAQGGFERERRGAIGVVQIQRA